MSNSKFSDRFSVAIFFTVSALWWIGSWMWPSTLNTDPTPVRELLSLMGLIFLACGCLCFYRDRTQWNLLFLLYCASAAIHWAGPLGNGESSIGLQLLFAYVLLGIALYASFFLHLALVYPSHRLGARSLLLVYLNSVVAMISIVLATMDVITDDAILVNFLVGSGVSLIAGVVWIYRLWLSDSLAIGKGESMLVTLALLVGWAPNAMVQYGMLPLGEVGGITNLSLLFTLVAFLWLSMNQHRF